MPVVHPSPVVYSERVRTRPALRGSVEWASAELLGLVGCVRLDGPLKNLQIAPDAGCHRLRLRR